MADKLYLNFEAASNMGRGKWGTAGPVVLKLTKPAPSSKPDAGLTHLTTVERGPTLSAERKVRAKSLDFAAFRLSIC
jgi:hypothetical protein